MSNGGGPTVAMMRYRCHKEVHAALITSIDTSRPVPRIYLNNYGFVDVGDTWLKEKRAQVGGYYVVYEDGYTSYSPAKAFEDGYTLVT